MNKPENETSQQGVIALLTDFGLSDGYVGTMKGIILGINPAVRIVDISHDIPQWNVKAAAFVLCASYKYFPAGTIHVCVVDPGVGSQREIILVKTERYMFLAPDNGLLSLVFEQEKESIFYLVKNSGYILPDVSHTFHGRDIFAPLAAHLSMNVPITDVAEPFDQPVAGLFPKPVVKNKIISGEIIYMDAFGNLISNISGQTLKNSGDVRQAVIAINKRIITGIHFSYTAVPEGELAALVSSAGYLEIGCNQCSAADVLSAGVGTPVEITCFTPLK